MTFPTRGPFSLAAVLAEQPSHVAAARFLNFEGQPEAGDLTNRFEQVTLFRTHAVSFPFCQRRLLRHGHLVRLSLLMSNMCECSP